MQGDVIFNATQILVETWKEIDALADKLFILLESELKSNSEISKIIDFGYDEPKGGNYVLEGWLYGYALTRSRARKPSCFLAIQVKLADDAEMSIVGREPLLYVLFSWQDWEYDRFSLATALPKGWTLQDSCLWEWFDTEKKRASNRPWYEAQWAFVLRLVSLNTEEDLKKQIVSPVSALLRGEPVEMAFGNAEKVMRFSVSGEEIRVIS